MLELLIVSFWQEETERKLDLIVGFWQEETEEKLDHFLMINRNLSLLFLTAASQIEPKRQTLPDVLAIM